MSATQVFPILNLSTDLLTLTSSYLGKNVLAFRNVCRRFKAVSVSTFEALQNKLFVNQYGARAECEKDIPVYTLIQRVESAAAIEKTWFIHLGKIIYDLELEIDPSGVPRLVNKNDLEYLVDSEFLRKRDEKVKNLVKLQDAIASEFDSQPLCSLHPLQDLRNRCRRLQILQEERNSLNHALQISSGSNNAVLSKLSVSFASLNEKGVKFGETKITFQGQEIPVEITAMFVPGNETTFSNETAFIVRRKDDRSIMGCFGIGRLWTYIKPDGSSGTYIRPDGSLGRVYSESMYNAGKHVGTFENPKLYIHYFENPELQQDSTNGDRPIMRLLTQIAVEIFQLETDNILEIRSRHSDADVYIAGGFSNLNPYRRDIDDYIKDDIQKARDGNKLFPAIDNRDLANFDVYLGKSPTNPLTCFVTKNKKNQEQPAMVDFDFDHPPITWEEQIKAHRLLPEKGPILPKFFLQDLSRFEKPSSEPPQRT